MGNCLMKLIRAALAFAVYCLMVLLGGSLTVVSPTAILFKLKLLSIIGVCICVLWVMGINIGRFIASCFLIFALGFALRVLLFDNENATTAGVLGWFFIMLPVVILMMIVWLFKLYHLAKRFRL
jgi:hypothetical protein